MPNSVHHHRAAGAVAANNISYVTGTSPGTLKGSTASTTLTLTLPTGWAAGDVVIFALSIHMTGALTTPSGWNKAPTSGTFTTSLTDFYVFWRLMQVGDSAPTVTVTSGVDFAVQSAAYRGVNATTQLDVTSVQTVVSSASTPHTVTGITPVTANSWVIVCFQMQSAGTVSSTSGATLTLRGTLVQSSTGGTASNHNNASLYDTGPVAASATGNWSFSLSGSFVGIHVVLALRTS